MPSDPSELESETTLLTGMIADEERAWRDFNDRYARLIYRCITRVTSRFSAVVGPDDVREIYAMLCVQLLANDKRKLRSFEPGRGNKLGSWIGMLAIHSAYDHLRSLRREPKRGNLSEAEGLSSELPDPHDVCVLRQQVGIVSEILADFSDKDREFITLYYGEGLEPEEIAERMTISVKTVYSKKHKIRSRLEALLVDRRLAA
ncbi:MAG: sigma-70 family RNA polymerase sigma factor [Myxococcales bacterium]|nr:sigma-70 family RNA polymerase sigma factor [Myxococcales bacterium]